MDATVKPVNIHDVEIQCYVMNGCEETVSNMVLMHINRDCVYPDMSNFFHQSDITVDVIQLLSGIEHNVEELRDYCTQDTLALVRIFQFLCDKLENNGFSIER